MTEFIGYITRPSHGERHGAVRKLWTAYMRLFATPGEAEQHRNYGSAGDPVYQVLLTLPEGAYFRVQGEHAGTSNHGVRKIGHYLDYGMAVRNAEGQASHGSFGYITIMVPEHQPVTAIQDDGTEIALAPKTSYRAAGINEYLVLVGEVSPTRLAV